MKSKIDYKRLGRVILIVIIAIIIVWAFIKYDEFQTKNGIRADYAAQDLINSMEYLGQLPWNVSEYRLRAILICPGAKVFVDNGKDLSTSALNCGYYLAEGVTIEARTNVWNGDGTVRFSIIPIE